MSKNPFSIEITHDVLGNPLRKGHKRQPISRSQKNIVFDSQKGKCWFCKERLNLSSTHFDHIKEVSRGGKSTIDNLRAVCANCHYERHNRDRATKIDKNKRKSNKNNTFINVLTGKKERFDIMKL